MRGGGGVSKMLTIADEGVCGSEKRVSMDTKNVDREENLTIHVNPSHVTCKLDPNK